MPEELKPWTQYLSLPTNNLCTCTLSASLYRFGTGVCFCEHCGKPTQESVNEMSIRHHKAMIAKLKDEMNLLEWIKFNKDYFPRFRQFLDVYKSTTGSILASAVYEEDITHILNSILPDFSNKLKQEELYLEKALQVAKDLETKRQDNGMKQLPKQKKEINDVGRN